MDRHAVQNRLKCFIELFDAGGFFDIADGVARVGKAEGSLAVRLPEVDESRRPKSGAIPVVQ